jgi:hypothetical protein
MFRPEAKDAELKQLKWDKATAWQFWLVVSAQTMNMRLTRFCEMASSGR